MAKKKRNTKSRIKKMSTKNVYMKSTRHSSFYCIACNIRCIRRSALDVYGMNFFSLYFTEKYGKKPVAMPSNNQTSYFSLCLRRWDPCVLYAIIQTTLLSVPQLQFVCWRIMMMMMILQISDVSIVCLIRFCSIPYSIYFILLFRCIKKEFLILVMTLGLALAPYLFRRRIICPQNRFR